MEGIEEAMNGVREDMSYCLPEVTGYEGLQKFLVRKRYDNDWVFRAQPANCVLKTTLERACNSWNFDLKAAHDIEYTMVREFRRLYKGEDQEYVRKDLLYCLGIFPRI